jgi:4-hydroxy-2-oxoheptanedioate aldolase
MKTPVNRFKAALRGGPVQYGLWLGLTDPVCIEIAAGAGFDWMCLDAEHAPHGAQSLLAGLQVAAAYPGHLVVRVPVGDVTVIKQVLDLGAQTLVVPMIESVEHARLIVDAARYPPHGLRGIGTAVARAARWSRADDYFERADAEMCVIAQIESARGLENLAAIAAVEGIDGLFIGPADLAASLGHTGNPGHPEVRSAMRRAFTMIRAAGKACGSISPDESVARQYIAEGCNFVAVGIDTTLLAQATSELARRFRPAS